MSKLDFDRSLAIVIGINQYENGIAPLRTAVADAEAIAQSLQSNHGYDVITLLDDNAELTHLQTLIRETLPAQVTADSRLVFYFAGHGIAQDGDDGPAGYLIPKDAAPGKIDSYLPMVELHDALTDLPCRHFLAIFDCCFAGAFRWSSTRDIDFVPEVIHQERYDRFRKDPAWQVITSASYDQKAMDVLSLRDDRGELADHHSPFAAALLDALRGSADAFPPATDDHPAGDGVITATELYLYLRDRVELLTEGQSKRQTPELCPLRKHDKGEFIFLTPGHVLNLPPAPELNKDNNPYRGLESFDQSHKNLFFGRDEEIEQLLQKVADPHPLTVVLGASGTGKSSLVKAGLLPRLEDHPAFEILPVMRPGYEPLSALARTCAQLNSEEDPKTLVRQFATDEQAFSRWVERWYKQQAAQHPETKLLLIIDQIEELITQSKQDSEQFQKLLENALSKQWQHLHVIATLRLDFEAQFQDDDWLGESWMDSRFVVPPMGQSQLREVIELPASIRVMCFEPSSLVDQLIEDVSQTPGALPLLSFTLSELYLRYLERRSDNRALTEADYRDLGGVAGSLTQRATAEYEALVAQYQAYEKTVKHVMLRMVAGEGGALARRRVPLSELLYEDGAENKRVQTFLNALIEARLVVKGQDGDSEPYAEPAHDALVRGWDKLLRWKNEEQVNLSLQRQLTPSANNWSSERGAGRGKQAAGFLWDDNPRLPLLKEVLESERNWLNRVEERFVKESVARKRKLRNQLLASGVGVFVCLSGLSAIALFQRQAAKAEAHRANEQNIYAESNSADALLAANQPLPGMVAAVRAWQSVQAAGLEKSAIAWQAKSALAKVTYADRLFNVGDVGDISTQQSSPFWFREKTFLKHRDRVRSVAYSPDGTTLATASEDNTVKLWDAATGALSTTLRHDAGVISLAYSGDGNSLATVSEKDTLTLWNTQTGEALNTMPVGTVDSGYQNATAVAMSPDGATLATASQDKTVKIWDVASGELRHTLGDYFFSEEGHADEVWSVAFSPDGKTLASASSDRVIKLWTVAKAPLKPTLKATLEGHTDSVYGVAFSPDGERLASASRDQTVKLWNANTGEALNTLEGHSSIVLTVGFSAVGDLLASASGDNTVKLWHVPTGDLLKTLDGHSAGVSSVAFSPDSTALATASIDKTVKLWAAPTDSMVKTLEGYPVGHSAGVTGVAYSPDGGALVTASHDGTVKLWDAESGALKYTLEGHADAAVGVAFSPTGKIVASTSHDHTVKLWDANTGALLNTLQGHDDWVIKAAFSPEGDLLATASEDRTVKLWDVSTGEVLRTLAGHEAGVTGVAFSPDGTLVASASGDHKAKLWDVDSGAIVHSLVGHGDDVKEVAFSPDGATLATASMDETAKLWDIRSGEMLNSLEDHTDKIFGLAYHPGGTTLATASMDNTVKLWDTKNAAVINTLEGHTSIVLNVAFSPDGNTLASVSHDQTIKQWSLNPERLVAWNCGWLGAFLTHNPEGRIAAAEEVCVE